MASKRKGTDGLIDRIGELERRIRELEARPVYVPYPVYPQPSVVPAPLPYVNPSIPWYTTCGSDGTMAGKSVAPAGFSVGFSTEQWTS